MSLALETKEMAVTLPAVLGLELLFLPALLGVREGAAFWSRLGRVLRRFALPLVALVLVALGGLVFGGFVHHVASSPHLLWGGDLFHHVLTIPALYAKYAELVLFPLRLYGDHIDYPPAAGWADVRVWFGGVLLIGVWAVGIGQARRRPYLAFGLLWFGVTMLPVSQIIPHHEILAEHYLYLPLIGLAVPVARGLELAWGHSRWRVAGQVVVSMVAILFALRVVDRNEDFRSERAFAEEILRHVPSSIRGHLTLAHAQQLENRPREAVESLRWVLEHIDSSNRFHHTATENLLTTLSAMGDLEAAEAQAFDMLQDYPNDPYASRVLGTLRARQGLLEKALAYQLRAHSRDPLDVEGRLHLGVTLLSLGRADEAEPHLEYAAQRWRRSPDAQLQWAMAAVQQGRTEVAARRLEAVLALDADNLWALEQLFVLARDAGDGSAACAYFRRLQSLRPDLRGIDVDCPKDSAGEL
jgi:tetratricopeptide (TPR) repeat protein